jgi:hypothetical protein
MARVFLTTSTFTWVGRKNLRSTALSWVMTSLQSQFQTILVEDIGTLSDFWIRAQECPVNINLSRSPKLPSDRSGLREVGGSDFEDVWRGDTSEFTHPSVCARHESQSTQATPRSCPGARIPRSAAPARETSALISRAILNQSGASSSMHLHHASAPCVAMHESRSLSHTMH